MSSESSSQRSSSCQVCGANKKTYHLNYGGAVCLSCRAFFRRKVKQKGQLRLYCKDNDKCQITEENRTSCCRKCRFEKCVKAGMRKESVLNEKQIKVRFRQFLKKRKKKPVGGRKANDSTDLPSGSGNNEEDNENAISRYEASGRDSQDMTYQISSLTSNVFSHHKESFNENQELKIDLPDIKNQIEIESIKLTEIISDNENVNCMNEIEQMDFILKAKQSWTESVSCHEPSDEFVHMIINVHNGCHAARNSVYRAMLRDHLKTFLYNVFDTFARKQNEISLFGSMLKQNSAIDKGSELFIQLIIGQYVIAMSGHEQLKWILLGKVPDFIELIPDLQRLSLCDLNNDLDLLMLDNSLMKMYEIYTLKLGMLNLSPETTVFAMALICLFYNCSNKKVKNHLDFIYSAFNYQNQRIEYPTGQTLFEAISIVVVMKDITSVNCKKQNSHSECMPFEIITSISDNILPFQDCRQRYHFVMNKVSFGRDIIREYILYNFGHPVSSNFFAHNLKVFSERFRQLMKHFSEFTQLSDADQMRIFENNIFKAVSFAIAASESSKDGKEQTDKAFGYEDSNIIAELLIAEGFPPNTQLKKISLANQPEVISQMNTVTQLRYKAIVRQLQEDLDLSLNSLTILLHIAMFTGLKDFRQLTALENRFKRILFNWLVYQEGNDVGRRKYENCMRQMNNVLCLAGILKSIAPK